MTSQQLTAPEILYTLGATGVSVLLERCGLRLVKMQPNRITFYCPDCGKPEAHVSAPTLNGDGLMMFCSRENKCGWRQSVVDRVKQYQNCNYPQALQIMAELAGTPRSVQNETPAKSKAPPSPAGSAVSSNPPPEPTVEYKTAEATGIWNNLEVTPDKMSEQWLISRGLLDAAHLTIPCTDIPIIKYTHSNALSHVIRARHRDAYRVCCALHNAAGEICTLQTRHVDTRSEPSELGKCPSLPGFPSPACGFGVPAFISEPLNDSVSMLLIEGLPDFLLACIATEFLARESNHTILPLGIPGTDVNILKDLPLGAIQTCYIALDRDPAANGYHDKKGIWRHGSVQRAAKILKERGVKPLRLNHRHLCCGREGKDLCDGLKAALEADASTAEALRFWSVLCLAYALKHAREI